MSAVVPMDRILISACLLGRPVRYDGTGRRLADPRLERWQAEGRLVPICPELMGELPVPRPAAEIAGGIGADVLAGRARVVTAAGEDMTAAFVAGAEVALDLARRNGCNFALLIDRSPSCGSFNIYDGTFSGRRMAGAGVTATLLAAHGIGVYADHEIDRLAEAVETGTRREPDAG
ncbi:DUF523 domain-containing protein [Pleomorphomonas diazotrophica]|uniref:DUF523 domain-containing protein n=2 Tax=Pleomorphomonas diazotrophica TaxID=1166257 RepID=A0A1I4SYL5_9HYPH|nr:DUF523 domain-containing protein [Pleomorphomonas diazotrophica]SFM69608.1 Uncharacterized conserved protein YbbK, DUF523 family [Pleomorphomonas diazotrophica]